MASGKNSPPRSTPTIVSAAAKTRSVIEDLQARLARDVGGVPETAVPAEPTTPSGVEPSETEEDLERQLEAYFERAAPHVRHATHVVAASRTGPLTELRSRVIDEVVDRILAEWTRSQHGVSPGAGLRREIINRLVDRVYEQFCKAAESSQADVA